MFYATNMVISLVCTSFLGVTYGNTFENLESSNGSKTIIADSELEPASQSGEGEKLDVAKNVANKKQATVTPKKTVASVSKREVTSTKKYTPAVYSEVTGTAIVNYAMKYLGLRYVSAGNSLSTGTDCSGFTKLIYKEFGVTLSRTVAGQMKNGTYVRKADLQKGDLVIYGNGSGKAVHVAMYIGNGKVIHESNHRDGVKISTVNMMQYITARRVINTTSIKIVEDKIQKEESLKKEETSKENVVNNTDNTTSTKENVVEENSNLNSDTNTKVEEKTTQETSIEKKEESNQETSKEETSVKVTDTKKEEVKETPKATLEENTENQA